MKPRRVASLTALLSFAFLMLTSLILYVVPHGRVAYWSDWRLWGLSKTQWGDLHINVGFLFLLSILLHIYYNWKQIAAYLKNPSRKMTVFTSEFILSLILLLAFCFGTFFTVPPFRWILDGNAAIKERAIGTYGEPPYGHAELSSLKIFAQKTGLELNPAMDRLHAAGITFEDERQTIQQIAVLNHMKPKDVYLAMLPETKLGSAPTLPEEPQPGLGRKRLSELCSQYDLDMTSVLKALANENLKADPDMTIREIGEQNQISPMDIYTTIRNRVTTENEGR
jgi:hypothetical protein